MEVKRLSSNLVVVLGPGSAGARLQYKVVTFGVSVRESTIQAYKRKCRETLVTIPVGVSEQQSPKAERSSAEGNER